MGKVPEENGLWIGVLGPFSGTRNGAPVRMPHGRSGALLAILAMSAGQPVGLQRLADLIWSDEQPERVRASMHSMVARVRVLVPDVVVTAADGYLLDLDPDHVDLLRFRRLMRSADKAADDGTAAGLLDQALGLWRGEPLADLPSPALHRDVVPGLVEERLNAVQRRAELDLAAGRPDQVIPRLEALVGQHQLREPLWAQLIRALAAAGRPAEAIQHYHRAREILADELGIDPSADLQDLYRHLLQAAPYPASTQPSSEEPAAELPGLPPPELGESADVPGDGAPGAVAAPRGRAPDVPRQLPADTRAFTGRQAE